MSKYISYWIYSGKSLYSGRLLHCLRSPNCTIGCWCVGEYVLALLVNNQTKLRWFGVLNRIINDYNLNPSKFGRQLNDDSDFNVKIGFRLKVYVNLFRPIFKKMSHFWSFSINFWLKDQKWSIIFEKAEINRKVNGFFQFLIIFWPILIKSTEF